MTPQQALVNTALSQVGYAAAAGKVNKYAAELDALGDVYNGPKNGFDWCDVFVDWCFIKTFGVDLGERMLFQPKKSTGAGCPFSANFFRKAGRFSLIPQIGAQIFFGDSGDEYHTGIVVGVDSTKVTTVEGNTGGGDGSVLEKTYLRGNRDISGYGIPLWNLVNSIDVSPKNLYEVAKDVIAGKYGNGSDRVKRLENAGYNAGEVQNNVNNLLAAYRVIAGDYGNGSERVKKLKAAGYDVNAVQDMVNRVLC